MKGASVVFPGLLCALTARPALGEPPIGTPPPAPAGAAAAGTNGASEPARAGTPAPEPTPATASPPPTTAAPMITVGLPQPSVRPINSSIGIGVALTYVSIPLVFVSGGVLAVGYLVDSTGVKITGWAMTGGSLVMFGVGVGFLVSGSQTGPQPQKSALLVGGDRPMRFELPRRPEQRDPPAHGAAFGVPVVSGTF